MIVEQTYITEPGRRRRRGVRVDLDEVRRGLEIPTAADRGDWHQIRRLLEGTVGESRFEIWLGPLELIAIDRDVYGVDVIAAAPALAGTEMSLVGELGRERFLRDALEPVLGDYDDAACAKSRSTTRRSACRGVPRGTLGRRPDLGFERTNRPAALERCVVPGGASSPDAARTSVIASTSNRRGSGGLRGMCEEVCRGSYERSGLASRR